MDRLRAVTIGFNLNILLIGRNNWLARQIYIVRLFCGSLLNCTDSHLLAICYFFKDKIIESVLFSQSLGGGVFMLKGVLVFHQIPECFSAAFYYSQLSMCLYSGFWYRLRPYSFIDWLPDCADLFCVQPGVTAFFL